MFIKEEEAMMKEGVDELSEALVNIEENINKLLQGSHGITMLSIDLLLKDVMDFVRFL